MQILAAAECQGTLLKQLVTWLISSYKCLNSIFMRLIVIVMSTDVKQLPKSWIF